MHAWIDIRTCMLPLLIRRALAALAAATLLSAPAGCGPAMGPGIVAALKNGPIAPRDQQLEAIERLPAKRRPQRLTTIECRVGTPVLRIIHRSLDDGVLLSDLHMLEGWRADWAGTCRLYAT